MKTSILYSFLLILTIALISCKKEFPKDALAIKNLSVDGCKSIEDDAKGDNPFPSEYITLETVDDFYIHFNHINGIFNCDPGQINVSIDISSTIITINENETKAGADCMCPYDVVFSLGPLEYRTYTIILQKNGGDFKEFSLDYNRSTNIRIDI